LDVFSDYLTNIKNKLYTGDTTEHSYRPALQDLLEALDKGISATNEPKRIRCGAPDFKITRKTVPLGYIETKDIGTNLDEIEQRKGPHGDQFIRFRDGLPNWILTDYLQFRWFTKGKKRLTARLAELGAKGKITATKDGEQELSELLQDFLSEPALTVATAKDLATSMAHMTRIVRSQIVDTFKIEAEESEGYPARPWLHNWLAAFRETLIPDLDENQFADMFAQTLAYGLFAARVQIPPNEDFIRKTAAYNLPKTNPFLRKLFEEIAGVDMPESIAWAVDDIVELLKHANMAEILKDFGKGKGKEDPIVHFYETFLAAYDPKMREVRGVYYTPEPVVSYIVRSIDYLLKSRFSRAKGLADENTLILDPATGTATFLYFVIDQIHGNFGGQAGAWDGYVDKHLLNRIFGFELLMAPYAVAHLKLSMQLKQTGYQFSSNQRLGIYLTNTLEESAKRSEELFTQWIAAEANAAAKIKRDDPILVILGNPPYSGHSANRSRDDNGNLTFIGKLIEDYKFVDDKPLGERNPKWLQDDYVKFLRFAQWRIERTGEGIVGFITNNGFLDNPTFRGMRQSFIRAFNEIYIYDLHGNAKKNERSPDGGEDKNVFDIMQGVSIILSVKQKNNKQQAHVYHSDLWGLRDTKYNQLLSTDIRSTEWKKLEPSSAFYLFVPQDTRKREEYEQAIKITDIYPINSVAPVTGRDNLVLDYDERQLKDRVGKLLSGQSSQNYGLDIPRLKKIQNTKESGVFTLCTFKPFNIRPMYYHPDVFERARYNVAYNMLQHNLALYFTRTISPGIPISHFLASRYLPIGRTFSDLAAITYFAPLYIYPVPKENGINLDGQIGARPNISRSFLKLMAEKLKLSQERPDSLPNGISAEDIFNYTYAVLHSPKFRNRYAEFLKIDFPRLPLTSNLRQFQSLAAKGAELVSYHLLEHSRLQDIKKLITAWPIKGDNIVDKVEYSAKDKRAWINETQYFEGIPKGVWEFIIGGYHICEKWLKDRKGQKLSYDDIQDYQKIVVALNETIRLMCEIDKIIPSWPIA
jgi:predicted helicase